MTDAQVIRKEDRGIIGTYLSQRIAAPVSLEVWTRKESGLILTDRDPCTFCEPVVQAVRTIASLHPLITVTLYDLDKHADRAAEAGIERPPTTVVRGQHGRSFRTVGLWAGLLFTPFLDALGYFSASFTPLKEEQAQRLSTLETDVDIELLAAPYDPYSAHMLRLMAAAAVVTSKIHFQCVDISEFPILAASRVVTELPVVTINRRRFVGVWDEDDFVEQLMRVVEGNAEPVIRPQVLVNPFLTYEQAQELAVQQAAQAPPTTPSGLIIPGR